MLSQEDNELLTRVGPGTAMGNLLRQYWLPALLPSELPERDGPPLRVRLLGENLIAFRDTEGRAGLLADNCSHRGASLFYGRNEEGGLRCVYHGWKYDVAGNCVDMPNEPPESNFKDKIHHRAYPCRELNGIIWTYMGPRDEPPPLPEFELAMVPESYKSIKLAVRECNWMQSLEGDLDLSHGAYLHSPLRHEDVGTNHTDRFTGEHPHFEALDTEYGVMHAVRRFADDEHYHWGVGHFLFPFFALFPPIGDGAEAVPGHLWVPMDDEMTLVWSFSWHPSRPIRPGEPFTSSRSPSPDARPYLQQEEEYRPATTEPAGAWRLKASRHNDYLMEYEAQRTRRFSGVPTVNLQDQAMQEGMGSISDRSIEHLGATDVAQIRVRHRLLEAAKALRDHNAPAPAVDTPSVYRVRSGSGILPKDVPWLEGTEAWYTARPEVPVSARGHRR